MSTETSKIEKKTALEQSQMLQKQIVLTIQGFNYTCTFPKVGQIIDIESNKLTFSNNKYPAMVKSNLVGANMALDLIESISYFSVLIPDLIKDLKINNIFDLDLISSREIVKVYKRDFLPWYNSFIEVLKEFDSEEISA